MERERWIFHVKIVQHLMRRYIFFFNAEDAENAEIFSMTFLYLNKRYRGEESSIP